MTRGCSCRYLSSLSCVVLLVHSDVAAKLSDFLLKKQEVDVNSLGIAAVSSVWICAAIVLSILRCVVGCSVAGAADSRRCWTISRARIRTISPISAIGASMRSAAMVISSSVSSTISAAASTTTVTGRATFEFFVLLFHVGNKIFAKLLGFLNHVRIRAPGKC